MNYPCSKCGALSFIRAEGRDIIQHCRHCGLHKVLQTTYANGRTVLNRDPPKNRAGLPGRETKLFRCLVVLYQHGEPRSTDQMADMLTQTKGDTASQLAVLRAKGLVDKVDDNRGKIGGSIWRITAQTKVLMD